MAPGGNVGKQQPPSMGIQEEAQSNTKVDNSTIGNQETALLISIKHKKFWEDTQDFSADLLPVMKESRQKLSSTDCKGKTASALNKDLGNKQQQQQEDVNMRGASENED